jgi:hypothetical protein
VDLARGDGGGGGGGGCTSSFYHCGPMAELMEEGGMIPSKIPPPVAVEGLEEGSWEQQVCFWFSSWNQTTINVCHPAQPLCS